MTAQPRRETFAKAVSVSPETQKPERPVFKQQQQDQGCPVTRAIRQQQQMQQQRQM